MWFGMIWAVNRKRAPMGLRDRCPARRVSPRPARRTERLLRVIRGEGL